MDKKRFLGVIVGATLIIAVALVALGYNAAPMATGSSASSAGSGDLSQIGAQPASRVEAFDAAWWRNSRSRSAAPAISQNATVYDARWWDNARSRSGITASSPPTSALNVMSRRSAGKQSVTIVKYGPPGR